MKKKSKYRNVKVVVDGEKYDSIKESKRGSVLKLLEKKGFISELKRQVRFSWIDITHTLLSTETNTVEYKTKKKKTYIADFTYIKDNEFIVEDVKGFKTDVYLAKKKIMKQLYNIDILET